MRTADFELRVPLMSKARPRSPRGGGRPYMPKAYMQWKATVRALLAEWWTIPPLADVRCLVLVFRGPARGDLDNLAGALLDAGNGLLWTDDRVSVMPCMALRFTKTNRDNQSIYLKVIWDEQPVPAAS
jgi:Holliday junction resolvase RusA-like endonuclease